MTPHEIVEQYYECWLRSDRDGARALVADDLKFRSPQDDFDRADDFFEKCWAFSEGFDEMKVEHRVADAEAVYLVYSSGDFACGELHKVRDGKITEIYVTFEPTR